MVKKFKDETITIETIKSDLIDEYKRLVTKQDDENEGGLIIDMDRNQKIIKHNLEKLYLVMKYGNQSQYGGELILNESLRIKALRPLQKMLMMS